MVTLLTIIPIQTLLVIGKIALILKPLLLMKAFQESLLSANNSLPFLGQMCRPNAG